MPERLTQLSPLTIQTSAGQFKLWNREKLSRITDGQQDSHGQFVAGLGEDAIKNDPDKVIALYDRLGGRITDVKNGAKVLIGSFYDFKARRPREKAEISFVFRINGKKVVMKDGQEKPIEVKAAELQQQVEEKEKEEQAEEREAKRGRGRPRKEE